MGSATNRAEQDKFLVDPATGISYGYTPILAKRKPHFVLSDSAENRVPQKPLEEQEVTLNPVAPVVDAHDPEAPDGEIEQAPAAGETVADENALFAAIEAIDSVDAAVAMAAQLNIDLGETDGADLDQLKAQLVSARVSME